MYTRHGGKRIGIFVILGIVFSLAAAPARADQVKLNVALSHPALQAGRAQTTYLKVGLEGFKMKNEARTPINVALVLDKSGSMSGQKIAQARQAAIMAVNRLRSDDIVSVIVYDATVRVLVPATKAQEKAAIIRKIRSLGASGSTALYGGVKKGGQEVRKFLSRNRINRIVLMSDGLANVGPDSIPEIAGLGA
ncbi:MAG: vWA domain-containing protein [Candidatus Brocadiia bacterium]